MTSKLTELSISPPAAMPKSTLLNKLANKVFIIGLPRMGTTSVSVAVLEQGLTVAQLTPYAKFNQWPKLQTYLLGWCLTIFHITL